MRLTDYDANHKRKSKKRNFTLIMGLFAQFFNLLLHLEATVYCIFCVNPIYCYYISHAFFIIIKNHFILWYFIKRLCKRQLFKEIMVFVEIYCCMIYVTLSIFTFSFKINHLHYYNICFYLAQSFIIYYVKK